MKRLLAVLVFLSAPAFAQVPPIPDLDIWESKMVTYADAHCATLAAAVAANPNSDASLGPTFYDGERVMLQVETYTGDSAYGTCADNMEIAYRDNYVLDQPTPGAVSGFWNFSRGLRQDYEATADATSYSAVNLLSDNAAYCAPTTYASTTSPVYMREAAYCLLAELNAEAIGHTPSGERDTVKNNLLGHLDQLFTSQTYRATAYDVGNTYPQCVGYYFYQPFMVGLVARALIQYYEETSADANIVTAITNALDTVWTDAWVAADESMWLANCKPTPGDTWPVKSGAPDVNQLIAPAYMWVYNRTCDTVCDTGYRDKADALFSGGARLAAVHYSPKHFNESYLWSFQYVTWRQAESITLPHLDTPDITVGDDYAIVTASSYALSHEDSCAITFKLAADDSTVDTVTVATGLRRRKFITTALSAGTDYYYMQSCNGLTSDTNQYAFTTLATPAAGARSIDIQVGTPIHVGAARMTVEYDDNAALSSSATSQNTSCGSGCTEALSLTPGLWYYRVIWQAADDSTLATSSVQALPVL